MGVFPTACPRQIHHRSKSPRPIGLLEHGFFMIVHPFLNPSSICSNIFHMFPYVLGIFHSNSPCQSLPSGRMWPVPRFQCWPRPQTASDRVTWPGHGAAPLEVANPDVVRPDGNASPMPGRCPWKPRIRRWYEYDMNMIWIWYEYDMNMMEYQIYIYSTHTSYTYIMCIYIW